MFIVLDVFCFLVGYSHLLELIRLNESGLLLLSSSSASSNFHPPPLYFTLHPSFAPHSPPTPSRCVNQYSLLTHDSPHMSFTAPGLHWGAGIVRARVCVCVHMSECNFDVSSVLFSLCVFVYVCTRVCIHVCMWLKIHQACLGFLQRAAAVGSNQPPLPMSEHTNPFVYLSSCCVCVCVCM